MTALDDAIGPFVVGALVAVSRDYLAAGRFAELLLIPTSARSVGFQVRCFPSGNGRKLEELQSLT